MNSYRIIVEGVVYFNICKGSDVVTDGGDFEMIGDFDSGEIYSTIEWYLAELQSNISRIVRLRLKIDAETEEEAKKKAIDYINNKVCIPTIRMYGRVFEGEFSIIAIHFEDI